LLPPLGLAQGFRYRGGSFFSDLLERSDASPGKSSHRGPELAENPSDADAGIMQCVPRETLIY